MTTQTEAIAIVHVAGPTEIERPRDRLGIATSSAKAGELTTVRLAPVVREITVQRCLRCDTLVSISGSKTKGAFWKLGTRIAIIEVEGRQRLYVVEDRLLAESEHICSYR